METETVKHRLTVVLAAALAIGLFALGLTIAGWLRYGSDILLTAASQGLSWCF